MNQTHNEYGMTAREYGLYRNKAIARGVVREEMKKAGCRRAINKEDVAYLTKCLEAPDVNLFLRLV
jgi:hypothetical protein